MHPHFVHMYILCTFTSVWTLTSAVLWPQMVGLYKRRKNNTIDAALDFALPTTTATSALQQAQVTVLQDEIHVLKKQLYEVRKFVHCAVYNCVCMVDVCSVCACMSLHMAVSMKHAWCACICLHASLSLWWCSKSCLCKCVCCVHLTDQCPSLSPVADVA